MNVSILSGKLFLPALFLMLGTAPGYTQDVVRVLTDRTIIHDEPDSGTSRQMEARKGELFEVERYTGGWIGIRMYSGRTRYMKPDDVEIVHTYFTEQVDFSTIMGMCNEVKEIEIKAMEEARSTHPDDGTEAVNHKNFLIDRHILNLFRTHRIPTTYTSIFLDCLNDSVMPGFDM